MADVPGTKAEPLTAFASDLGFKPGVWPRGVEHAGHTFELLGLYRDADGDVKYALYRAATTVDVLHVFND